MTVYSNIYNILVGEYIPEDVKNNIYNVNLRMNNCNNSITIIDLLKEKNELFEKKCYYNFWLNNKNTTNKFDLHNIQSSFVNDILDAIYDYCIYNEIRQYFIITGKGTIIKPKVIKYLKEYNMKYDLENSGLIYIKI